MLRFGDFVLDRDARQLFRGGIQVHLPPKALELLAPLVSSRPKTLPKSAIRDDGRPDVAVGEASLTVAVAALGMTRKNRGESGDPASRSENAIGRHEGSVTRQ